MSKGDKLGLVTSADFSFSSKSNEWYTPRKIIDLVYETLGRIDLDPASNWKVNHESINATVYYDESQNGLKFPWYGKVFLNPPYGKENGKSNTEIWVNKLLAEFEARRVEEAILLINASTDTKTFHKLAKEGFPVCFPLGRISFYNNEGKSNSPTHGNAIWYLGNNTEKFIKTFKDLGVIMECTS